ncbi:hypothetical protein BofuT4_P140380.1 [Botrytis cinerea T4]|uniref:Uncharacterized protein n=1 Tax=Botryotinia fuckeliana (strain T4) TaxID=999810 RepID=G2YYS8_BOTF4|nr:hypothetical protein BofuT4_P140380.1 [Botrytis cinerea T4]
MIDKSKTRNVTTPKPWRILVAYAREPRKSEGVLEEIDIGIIITKIDIKMDDPFQGGSGQVGRSVGRSVGGLMDGWTARWIDIHSHCPVAVI